MRKIDFAAITFGVAAVAGLLVWYIPEIFSKPKAPPMIPPQRKAEYVAPAYVWVDNTGYLTFGQLRDVPPECFHGFDTVKGWAHGLIKKPIVGKSW